MTTQYTKDSSCNDVCPICVESLGDEGLLVLPCHHSFHTGCIAKWIPSGEISSCPLCRQNLHYACGCRISIDQILKSSIEFKNFQEPMPPLALSLAEFDDACHKCAPTPAAKALMKKELEKDSEPTAASGDDPFLLAQTVVYEYIMDRGWKTTAEHLFLLARDSTIAHAYWAASTTEYRQMGIMMEEMQREDSSHCQEHWLEVLDLAGSWTCDFLRWVWKNHFEDNASILRPLTDAHPGDKRVEALVYSLLRVMENLEPDMAQYMPGEKYRWKEFDGDPVGFIDFLEATD